MRDHLDLQTIILLYSSTYCFLRREKERKFSKIIPNYTFWSTIIYIYIYIYILLFLKWLWLLFCYFHSSYRTLPIYNRNCVLLSLVRCKGTVITFWDAHVAALSIVLPWPQPIRDGGNCRHLCRTTPVTAAFSYLSWVLKHKFSSRHFIFAFERVGTCLRASEVQDVLRLSYTKWHRKSIRDWRTRLSTVFRYYYFCYYFQTNLFADLLHNTF